MVSLGDICITLSVTICFVLMILIVRVVYRERCFESKKAWMIFGGLFAAGNGLALLIPGDGKIGVQALVMAVSFIFVIAITRKKRRFRGFFLFLPVVGMVLSLEMIPQMIWMVFTGISADDMGDTMLVVEVIYELFLLAAFLFWEKRFYKTRPYNELGVWERRILNGNGMLLLVIYTVVVSIPKGLSQYEKYILVGGALIALMLCGSTIGMVMKSIRADYYKNTAELNEYYLNMQLNHFKAYQETQRETRRIRHDMKNHMICACRLFQNGEQELLGEYLRELSSLTQKIDGEHHIGNDMADAIINEKFTLMKQSGIKLVIDGHMAGIESIAPVDICTIFANALDNAMEALAETELMNPYVEISVKREKRLLLLSFINPCGIVRPGKVSFMTSKQDKANHGFGLENIRLAAEKYKGSIACRVIEQEGTSKLFSLEVMLFV